MGGGGGAPATDVVVAAFDDEGGGADEGGGGRDGCLALSGTLEPLVLGRGRGVGSVLGTTFAPFVSQLTVDFGRSLVSGWALAGALPGVVSSTATLLGGSLTLADVTTILLSYCGSVLGGKRRGTTDGLSTFRALGGVPIGELSALILLTEEGRGGRGDRILDWVSFCFVAASVFKSDGRLFLNFSESWREICDGCFSAMAVSCNSTAGCLGLLEAALTVDPAGCFGLLVAALTVDPAGCLGLLVAALTVEPAGCFGLLVAALTAEPAGCLGLLAAALIVDPTGCLGLLVAALTVDPAGCLGLLVAALTVDPAGCLGLLVAILTVEPAVYFGLLVAALIVDPTGCFGLLVAALTVDLAGCLGLLVAVLTVEDPVACLGLPVAATCLGLPVAAPTVEDPEALTSMGTLGPAGSGEENFFFRFLAVPPSLSFSSKLVIPLASMVRLSVCCLRASR